MKHLVIFFIAIIFAGSSFAFAGDADKAQIAALQEEQAQALNRVVDIINQPVRAYPRRSWASTYSTGWFHPGAITPDFDNVDIRATQELTYKGYVTSNLTPTQMFYGPDLEFNSMTKYFYTDRSLPKKRLSEAEMLEINQLYRVIGKDEKALAALEGREVVTSGNAPAKKSSPPFGWIAIGLVVLPIALTLLRRKHG